MRYAIVGIGCRFPGHANSPEEFWTLLCQGVDAIRDIPEDRFDMRRFYDPDPSRPGRCYVRHAGIADHAGDFDASFFGISRREAVHIDPQQRMLLEVAWEAIEDAGLPAERIAGSQTGVYVGISSHDFASMLAHEPNRNRIGAHSLTGTAASIAANRLSYQLDLHGPSMAIDTACSSSLTAVHLACRGLASGECELALAGGVNLFLGPETAITMAKASMLSPDGRSKAFDARANGYVRGEGAGIIVLKPLECALRDQDRIYAVICGTAINQDGRTVGMTVPSADAQTRMIREALRAAGASPEDIHYVEAHGTGTPAGDPVEAAAIGEALGRRDPAETCLIGSVKTNIGHLEAAAGIAGLIKAALVLQHRAIPPSLHFDTPNPAIPFEQLRLRVVTRLQPWPSTRGRAMAAVNSFGVGGANAHAMLEGPPLETPVPPQESDGPRVLLLSARTSEALTDAAHRLAAHLREQKPPVEDVCYTSATRRTHHHHRMAVIASNCDDLAARLERADAITGSVRHSGSPRLAFVYSGMGLQRTGMGRDLFRHEPVFRRVLESCDTLLHPWAGWGLLEALDDDDEARAAEPAIAQVANFALQAALTDLWRSWGVVPDAVAGHSVGEVAAAYASGALSLEDGLRLAYHRGRLAQRVSGHGGMLVASISAVDAADVVKRYEPGITLAAVNSPSSVTFSGDTVALSRIAGELEQRRVFSRIVPVTVPYHGPALDPFRGELIESLRDLAPRKPGIPMASTAFGGWVNGVPLGPDHWWQEFRRPVQFARAIELLIQDGVEIFLEVGPHSSLKSPISECLAHANGNGAVLYTLRRGEHDRAAILRAAAALHVRGRRIDWSGVMRGRGRCIALPTYPWQHEDFGTGQSSLPQGPAQPAGTDSGHPLLGVRLHSAHPSWQANLADDRVSYLDGHVVQDAVVFPAAAYVEASLAAGDELWPGTGADIEQVEFRKMLVLPPGRAAVTQWTCDASGAFEIFSAPAGAASWTQHAAGALRQKPTSKTPGAFDLDAIRERCTQAIPVADWYQWYGRRGLHYSGVFRSVEAVWQGNGEALAQIGLPHDPGCYHIHPGLLDAAFQVLGAAIHRSPSHGAVSGTLLPASIAAVRLRGPVAPRLWAHATLQSATSDAFEGDIRLLDDAGLEVIFIERLRCLLVGTPAASSSTNALLCRVRWHEHSVEKRVRVTLRPSEAVAPAIENGPRVAASAGLADYHAGIEARLNTLSAAFVHAALRRRPAVIPGHRQYFDRLLEIARDHPDCSATETVCREMAADLRKAHPAWAGMVDLVAQCGESLELVLAGELDAHELLFGPEGIGCLTDFYCNSPIFAYYNRMVAEVVSSVARERAGGARLRILELGAGTGGTTTAVLAHLSKGSTDYVFSDISPFFLSRARTRFAGRDDLHFTLLDIETGRSESSLPCEEFDIILASDALHTAADLRQAIRHARRRLAPHGLLIVLEASRVIAWSDLVFGLFQGWWRFADRDTRDGHPLLTRARWLDVLRSEGMDEVVALPELECEGAAAKTLIVARRAPDEAGQWLVMGGGEAATMVAEALARRGERPIVQPRGLPGDIATRQWAGVIHLASLDRVWSGNLTASTLLEFQTDMYAGIVDLLRGLAARGDDLPPLWLVTAGAQAAGSEDLLPNPYQAGLWGLGRVLSTEFPKARCHLADLSPACDAGEIESLVNCIVNGDPEDEIAFRGSDCFAARVESVSNAEFRDESERVVSVDSAQVRLEVGEIGSLDSLTLREVRPVRPGPNELLVKVHAAGLNFRDIMLSLGVLPVSRPAIDSKLPLGFECAGVVLEVGAAVTGFEPGDEIVAVTHGAFATHAIVREAATVRKPASLSFEDAAATLAAFTTAHYGLCHLAGITAGERVLIHSATGGVGMAAIQVCRAAGAEILATAGTPEKRDLLRSMGIACVMDSRSLSFADEITAATSGEGIDVVLNSLPGEAIGKGLSVLRSGGRFIELGKRDLLDNSRLGLRPFERTLSFISVDLDRLFRERTAKVGQLAAEVMREFTSGRYTPLPRTDFPLTDAPAAFRSMSQARHVGKIVLTVREPEYCVKSTRAQWLFRDNVTYLITGGLGGFGLAVARWMLSQGARTLVLMGRKETPIPENEPAYRDLLASGAAVRVLRGDVSQEADVVRVLALIRAEMPPLGGVLHGAMTLEDGALLDLTPQQWREVLTPKAIGAWLLDRLTQGEDLDCFVLFSSAASIVGSPMQGNYAAANAFLDALAYHRRARGVPGLAVCWGVLAGAGYVSRQPEVQRYLERMGHRSISIAEALEALEILLRSRQANGIAGRVEWREFRRSFPAASRRRFSALPGFADVEQAPQTTSPQDSLVVALQQGDPKSRTAAAYNYVLQRVARVLTEPEYKIDTEAPLTNIGLDSLMAVELQTLFHVDLGLRIAATRLLQGITLRGLADLLLAQLQGDTPRALRPSSTAAAHQRRCLPLAFEQRRLWFLQQLYPTSPVYNVPLAVRFTGELNQRLLHQALREVVRRHEALRAVFALEADEPVQIIAENVDLSLPETDLETFEPEPRDAEVLRLKQEEAALPFDLSQSPLLRSRLLRLSPREHILLITMHHLIVDAWSVPVIARDTALIYQRLVDGQPPTLSAPAPAYADFIAGQQASQSDADQLEYWKQQLDGVPRLCLPADRPHPPQRTFSGARLEFPLDVGSVDLLERCGRTEGATLFMTLLAAFELLLYRYSGQDDFCVGTPVATRAREEAMDRVGCLVNTLAMRARLSGAMTFRDLLRAVRESVLTALEHQDVTWEKVVEAIRPERDPSRLPIFQVLLVVHHIALQQVEFPGLVMAPEYTGNRSTTFDLVLLVDAARRHAAFEYNTDIFDSATIARISGHLCQLLAAIVRAPDSLLRDLDILTEAEHRQVLCEWNSVPAPWCHERCLHHLFEEQVIRTPDAIAVTDEARYLTYAQLDRAANQLAKRLERSGVRAESRVVIFVDGSVLAVVAILAVLKAGGAYVPVDSSYPRERIEFVLCDAAPDLVLTELPDLDELLAAPAVAPPEAAASPSQLAYLMYTSGSTGQPKGVQIEHRSICNQVLWRQHAFPLDGSDAVLQTTSLSFDPSVWEIFGPLVAGASIVIPQGHSSSDGESINRAIRAHRVTVLQGVPSLLRSLLEQNALSGCESLRHVFCGGEPLDNCLVAGILRVTSAAVHHLYGCTETSIDATCLPRVTVGELAAPPVGQPIGNARVYVLDQFLRPVPIGVTGEIYVGGAGVARGYWNRPALNQSRFLPDPFGAGDRMYQTGDMGRFRPDGNIELLGRADRQIKLRGFRMEPAEIETPLRLHPSVRAGVVAVRTVGNDAALIAWLTLRNGTEWSACDASSYLSRRLPRFMVPQYWVFLDSLPLTPDGKIDLKALPDPQPIGRAGHPATERQPTPLESRIRGVWEEVLSLRPVGLHEDFFALGGHSLLAARLAVRLNAEVGLEVPLHHIFNHPTVSELAAAIGDGGVTGRL